MKKLLALTSAVVLLGAAAAPALALTDSWDMEANMNDIVGESGGSNRDIVMHETGTGNWDDTANAVSFTDAPAWGEIRNTSDKNPGTSLVAIGSKVTVSIPNNVTNYSGNVIQKGFFDDGQQIKLQIVPGGLGNGKFECRFDGTVNDYILPSSIGHMDDGENHVAYCVRNGDTLRITVDGTTDTFDRNVGSIAPDRNIFVGNRGSDGGKQDQHFGKNFCSAYAYGGGAIDYVDNKLNSTC